MDVGSAAVPLIAFSVLSSRAALYSRCTAEIWTDFLAISSRRNEILWASCWLPVLLILFWLICRFNSLSSRSAARFLDLSSSNSVSSSLSLDLRVLCCLLRDSTCSLSFSLSELVMFSFSIESWISYIRLRFSSSKVRRSFSKRCEQALLCASSYS